MQSWLLKDDKQMLGALNSLFKDLATSLNVENGESSTGLASLSSNSLDTQQGIDAMDGSTELYNDVVAMFAEKYRHIKSMQDLFDEEEAQDLRRFFHTIKGLAATIGAQRLQQISTILELQYASNTNNDSNITVESFVKELNSVCNDIYSFLDGKSDASKI